MKESNNTTTTADTTPYDEAKTFKKIVIILLAVGAAAVICLIFFFGTLFRIRSSREIPRLSNLRQLGATDSAVLLSWDVTGPADSYRIHVNNGSEAYVSDCDLPFAVVRELQPNSDYSVAIAAVKDGQEYGRQSIVCTTARFCEVTKVTAAKTGSDFLEVSWEYDGVNQGFQAAAYALDSKGRRHLTSDIVEIPPEGKTKCKISGLAAELNYTVIIMPLTRYGRVGRLTVQTDKYSNKYDKINIIRFVICSANVKDAVQVQDLSQLQAAKHYKTSLLLNGKTDETHTADFSLLITDTDGNLIDEEIYREMHTNPEGKQWFIHRSMLFDFYAPDQAGEYYLYLTVDGQTVDRMKFTVE